MALWLWISALGNLLFCAFASNILAVFPSVWQSHYLLGRRLLDALVADQNHTVTLISPYAESYEHGNYREFRIEGLQKNWLEMQMHFDIEQMWQQPLLESFTRLTYACTANVDLLLSDAKVRKLLRSEQHFDLLIVDLFLSDSLLGLAHFYQIPTIVISPTGANTWLNDMNGNPQSFALDPSNFLPYSERMNIWERSVNTLMRVYETLTYNFFHMISQQAIYAKHFEPLCQLANKTLPHHRELAKNLSLVLINSHPLIQYPRAYLPNMLEIAGMHLSREQPANLPAHLEKFIAAATKGTVYISLGANLRTTDLSEEKLEALLDVIVDLQHMHFLIKWEAQQFYKNLPKNVLINDWFPQEAVLAHPNVKVFISTCGLMSVIEAINGITPMLAIPVLPHQQVVAQRLQSNGVALIVPFDVINFDNIVYGVQQLAFNESYLKNMQLLHRLFWSDYGSSGLNKSLQYINLILTTGGGDFLKSHSKHLDFLRAELFDVLAVITFGVLSIMAIPFLLTCCILRKSYYNQSAAALNSSPSHRNLLVNHADNCADMASESIHYKHRCASTSSATSSSLHSNSSAPPTPT